ncbi:hypothetical protein ASPWEDRAFT_50745 [Aspergillus wentii DTO 134E9]|uniref:Uncharacterized protein n=1 Tax=Aspergillus wentii DTO 134E9 TaxID=1073089 RepID=A0A1L9RRM3_ASPWE|nr:uncharacterized protein ASPWEDRAFT_50745 [Aspergillus wentii DTO 134E9]OJJ37616.1 hypothetical protein ASPWEDRAFT_50745 [Aspergillus wentii DTO 134E9]
MTIERKLPIRILTHNIRYATSSPFKGELPWEDRRQHLINELQYNTRNQDAFICLQEALHPQLLDVLSGLNHTTITKNPPWEYIGVGRDDGKEAGEYSPILYRPSVWQLGHWETVWLSETPQVPSKSWDASSIRIVTIGVFTHRASHQTILAMNTHLDDQGSHSRLQAAHIILKKIHDYKTGELGDHIAGIFLAGDLNSEVTQEAYMALTTPESPLVDAGELVSPKEHYGNQITYTGFGYEEEPPSRIDYIFLGPGRNKVLASGTQPWKVEGYAVLANRFDDGVLNSDHRAVITDVALVN